MPLKAKIDDYFQREVLPHVPDAWIDETKTKVGYEIPLNRHFYRYEPPRDLLEIEDEDKPLSKIIEARKLMRDKVGKMFCLAATLHPTLLRS